MLRESNKIVRDLNNIFLALKSLKKTNIFMTMPNPDEGNFTIYKQIKNNVRNHDNFFHKIREVKTIYQ